MVEWFLMDIATFLKQIRKLPGYSDQVVHMERLPARRARYGQMDRPLPQALQSSLRDISAERLYTHQAQAINAVRAGQHVILSSGTASGKTLAYNIPVLEALVENRSARALYLFPTKALAQEGAAKGITVNAVAPGYIATDMVRAVPEPVLEKIKSRIPVGRLGEAEEIARGVLFLVADEAGFITGSTLSINGGQHMY